jgi:hypothetical protein
MHPKIDSLLKAELYRSMSLSIGSYPNEFLFNQIKGKKTKG